MRLQTHLVIVTAISVLFCPSVSFSRQDPEAALRRLARTHPQDAQRIRRACMSARAESLQRYLDCIDVRVSAELPAPRPPRAPPPPPPPVSVTKEGDYSIREYIGPPVIIPGPPPPPAPPPPSRTTVITNPNWVVRPDGAALIHMYPREAMAQGIEGQATIECDVLNDGRLHGCVIVNETPAGYGFGEATLRAAILFRMSPQTRDGVAVGGARVRIPLSWRLG